MEWFGHPIFPMGLAGHPNSAMGVASATPKGRLGVAELLHGAKKKKKKVWPRGWLAATPLGP
jgi:hypothetical protein